MAAKQHRIVRCEQKAGIGPVFQGLGVHSVVLSLPGHVVVWADYCLPLRWALRRCDLLIRLPEDRREFTPGAAKGLAGLDTTAITQRSVFEIDVRPGLDGTAILQFDRDVRQHGAVGRYHHTEGLASI